MIRKAGLHTCTPLKLENFIWSWKQKVNGLLPQLHYFKFEIGSFDVPSFSKLTDESIGSLVFGVVELFTLFKISMAHSTILRAIGGVGLMKGIRQHFIRNGFHFKVAKASNSFHTCCVFYMSPNKYLYSIIKL